MSQRAQILQPLHRILNISELHGLQLKLFYELILHFLASCRWCLHISTTLQLSQSLCKLDSLNILAGELFSRLRKIVLLIIQLLTALSNLTNDFFLFRQIIVMLLAFARQISKRSLLVLTSYLLDLLYFNLLRGYLGSLIVS